jgi:hypothetical protein
MAEPLFRTVEVKDRNGRVTGTKEVALYKGLLAKAHTEGLSRIRTQLSQIPTDDNGRTAISKALVVTSKGTFEAIGDASPENVPPHIRPHLIRMAETRAKARALRDAVNIGVVSLEELDGEPLAPVPADPGSGASAQNGSPAAKPVPPKNGPAPPAGNGYTPTMTENQRRYLFRILAGWGFHGDAAHEYLKDKLGVTSLAGVSKMEATKLIDRLLQNAPEVDRGAHQHQ